MSFTSTAADLDPTKDNEESLQMLSGSTPRNDELFAKKNGDDSEKLTPGESRQIRGKRLFLV